VEVGGGDDMTCIRCPCGTDDTGHSLGDPTVPFRVIHLDYLIERKEEGGGRRREEEKEEEGGVMEGGGGRRRRE